MKGTDLKNFINGLFPYTYTVGFMPPEPPDCAMIIFTPGGPPNPDLIGLSEKTFQILVRGADYSKAEDAINQMYTVLHGKDHVVIGNRYVYSIRAIQDPFPIGYDENDRALFNVNFRMETRPR